MKLRISMAIAAALLSSCGGGSDNKPAPVVETPAPVVETPPPPPENVAPVADAGADMSIDEQTAVTLSGNATDSDGTIASYLWTQTSGTSVILTNSDKAQASFIAPDVNANETLTFSLTVADDDGANHSDEVVVNVKHINIFPVANAGDDIETYGDSTYIISGSGADADGSIVSYSWKQTSGIEVNLTNADKAELSVVIPKLVQDETLTFELTVTDNSGATHSDVTSMLAKPLTWQTQSVNLLDIDGDNSLDLLIKQISGETNAQLMWSKGSGNDSFSSPSLIARFTDDILDSYSLDDFDGDGTLDLLSTYFNKDKSNIYVGLHRIQEATPLIERREIYSSANQNNVDARLTNMNGDGKADLVVVSDDKVELLLKLADGNFAEPTIMTKDWTIVKNYYPERQTVFQPTRFSLVDINGDGLSDIVWETSDASKGSFFFYLIYAAINNGSGQFSAPERLVLNSDSQSSSSTAGISYGIVDVDGDNVKDVITRQTDRSSMTQHTTIEVELHKFTPTTKSSSVFDTGASGSQYFSSTQIIDWNEDGILDLVLPVSAGESRAARQLLALGQGNGNFSEVIDIDEQFVPFFFDFTLDLDLDDTKDLIGRRSVLHENQDGTSFRRYYMFWHKKLKNYIEPRKDLFEYKGSYKGRYDLNNDGKMDFVSIDENRLYWYQNNGDLTFTERQITIPK